LVLVAAVGLREATIARPPHISKTVNTTPPTTAAATKPVDVRTGDGD
jgi:hypothetical protein